MSGDLTRSLFIGAGAGLLAASALGQDPTIEAVVLEGDSVPGVGLITRIDNLAVNNLGTTLVEADTDNANGDADTVLLRDGAPYLREGDPLAEPDGASIDSFDTVLINNNGDSGWNFFLDGTSGSSDDSGIYFNTTLVIQESDLSTAPEFTPGTPYIGFFETKFNDANQILIMASVDDPNIPSTVDRALVIASVDGSGNLLSEFVLWKEGDVLPGQSAPVEDFETGPHQFAFNNAGDVLFIAVLDDASATDQALYLNDQLLAQEGFPSPIQGRNYEFLTRTVALNDAGDWAVKANLDGDTADDEVIVLNDAVFVQEGGTIDAIAPFSFTGLGSSSGPIALSGNGDLLWYGEWDDPNADVDSGLFINDQLIIQEGVTEVDGQIIDSIASGQDSFSMSTDGSQIIFEATLLDGREGAFLATLDLGGELALSGPQPGLANQRNGWLAENATPDTRVYFVYSLQTGSTGVPGCPGVNVDIASPQIFSNGVADENGEALVIEFVPAAASGRTVFFQAVDAEHCEVSNLVEYTFP